MASNDLITLPRVTLDALIAEQEGRDAMNGREALTAADIPWGVRDGAVAAVPMVVVAAETILPFQTAAQLALHQPAAPAWFVPGFLAPGVVAEVVGKLKASPMRPSSDASATVREGAPIATSEQ